MHNPKVVTEIDPIYIRGICAPETLNTFSRTVTDSLDAEIIPPKVRQAVELITQCNLCNPVLHGGAIRDFFLGRELSCSSKATDLDVRASFPNGEIPPLEELLKNFSPLENIGYFPSLVEYTKKVVIVKFDSKSTPLDLVLTPEVWSAKRVALTNGISICTGAYSPGSKILVDENFIRDAKQGTFRSYRKIGQDNVGMISRLRQKFPRHFNTFIIQCENVSSGSEPRCVEISVTL